MTLCATLNTLLFLCAIRLFFLSYFRHPWRRCTALLVMFGGWWLGFHYSNVYALPVLFSVASFPSTTALGLTLLGFALIVRLLRAEVRRPRLCLVVLGLWAAAVFIIHPLTAMMSLSGALLLALAEPRASWRLRFAVASAVVVGCALSHFWPYFFAVGGAARRTRRICGLGRAKRAASSGIARQKEAARVLSTAAFAAGARLGHESPCSRCRTSCSGVSVGSWAWVH